MKSSGWIVSVIVAIGMSAGALAYVQQTQLTVGAVIQQQNLSANTCTAPCSGTVATISTVCSTPAQCTSPSYALSVTAPNCTSTNSANNQDFLVQGNTLSINPSGPDISGGGLRAGSYLICIGTTVTGNVYVNGVGFGQSITAQGAVTAAISVNGSTTGTTVTAGASISVAVSGGPAHNTDTMMICNADGASVSGGSCYSAGYDGKYLDCSSLSGEPPGNKPPPATGLASATCAMTAPGTNGNYFAVFAGWTGNNFSLPVYASAPFTVGGSTQPSITGVSVSPPPNNIAQGFAGTVGTLSTTCSATCPASASYAVGTGTGCAAADTADNNSFTVPSGTANLNTAASTNLGTVRAYRVGVVATMSGVSNSPSCWPQTVTVTAAAGPRITVNGQSSGATVASGASMTVAVSGGAGNANDWIGICNAGVTASNAQCDGAGYSWAYLKNCSQAAPSAPGVTSNNCSLIAPAVAGNYVANYFNVAVSAYNVGASAPFSVTSGSPAITVNGSSNATVTAGSTAAFAWSNGPLPGQNANSRIMICNSATFNSANCDAAGYSWAYTNSCSQTAGTAIVPSGSCNMSVPSTPQSYYAAWFASNTYDGGGGGGGGTGCQDADNHVAAGVPSNWTCDSAMSDDFDRDGGVFNTSKWTAGSYYLGNLTPVDTSTGACSTITGYPPMLDSQGLHQSNVAGTNATFVGAQTYSKWSGPAGSFYIEYKKRQLPPGNYYWINSDFFSENSGVPGPPEPLVGASSTSTEIDLPEGTTLNWFLWSPGWGGSGPGDQGYNYYPPSAWPQLGNFNADTNPHTVGMVRTTSGSGSSATAQFTFWVDGVQVSTNSVGGTPWPGPQKGIGGPQYSSFATSQMVWIFQGWHPYPQYSCPQANSDTVYQYIHVYHP